jgi:hypothetical protein
MLPLKAYRNLPLSLRPALEEPLDAYYAPVVYVVKPIKPTPMNRPAVTTFMGDDGDFTKSLTENQSQIDSIIEASKHYPPIWNRAEWEYEFYKRLDEAWKRATAPPYVPPTPTKVQKFKSWLHNTFVKVI